MRNLFDSGHGLNPCSSKNSFNIIISTTPFKKFWDPKAFTMCPIPDTDFEEQTNQPGSQELMLVMMVTMMTMMIS
jgi:hypothetical protein